MWFNTSLTVEPYPGLTSRASSVKAEPFEIASKNTKTGVAWLSSARVVRCWVKSRNERNPHQMLPARNGGNSSETARVSGRKVGMTSSQHGPYTWGYTHATMGEQWAAMPRGGANLKNTLSVQIGVCNSTP